MPAIPHTGKESRWLTLRQILTENRLFFLLLLSWLLSGAFILGLADRETLFFALNTRHHPLLDQLMTVLSAYGRGDCIPLLFLSLLLLPAFRTRDYLFNTVLYGVVSTLAVGILKNYFACPRPLLAYGLDRVHTVPWLDNAFYNSFPSGHTMGAFGAFMLLTFYLPAGKKGWSFLFFLLALGCGYSRVYLGQHFVKDVYAGSMLGVLIAFVLYYLSLRIFKSSTYSKQV